MQLEWPCQDGEGAPGWETVTVNMEKRTAAPVVLVCVWEAGVACRWGASPRVGGGRGMEAGMAAGSQKARVQHAGRGAVLGSQTQAPHPSRQAGAAQAMNQLLVAMHTLTQRQ